MLGGGAASEQAGGRAARGSHRLGVAVAKLGVLNGLGEAWCNESQRLQVPDGTMTKNQIQIIPALQRDFSAAARPATAV